MSCNLLLFSTAEELLLVIQHQQTYETPYIIYMYLQTRIPHMRYGVLEVHSFSAGDAESSSRGS